MIEEEAVRDAVCLFSGGPDSVVAAAIAKSEGYRLHLLTVDYGQRTSAKEIDCSVRCAAWLDAEEHRIPQSRWLWAVGGSAMLSGSDARITQQHRDSEYVPFRNTLLLSMAVAWAEVIPAEAVFIGSTGGPWITPDNNPDYFDAMQRVIELGTKLVTTVQIRAPLCTVPKRESVAAGLRLGVPFEATWSCQNDNEFPCLECNNCLDRIHAFDELGAVDPLLA